MYGMLPSPANGRVCGMRRLEGDESIEEPDVPIESINPVANARRRHGTAGAMLAAGMFGLDQFLGRKAKEEAPIVMAASDQPVDIDHEGIIVPVDDRFSVVAPPQPRSDPLPSRRRRRRRRS
jgi:hypothetical protein